jgi:GTP pyrophosphokinase
MFMAMARDIRVIIIKLADRLHNMRTLQSLPAAKQQTIARETIEIYAPIAHRLGIWKIKWDLEDLCLRYLDPEAYRDISERVAKKRGERESAVENVVGLLRSQFAKLAIEADVTGRPKHFYSIYSKLRKGRDFSTIYDLTAVRVIVDSVKDCYGALGIVHSTWKPIPGRFKDYIAMPKPNMYQSLHTTVVGPGGDPLEIQIRTLEMHRTSEYGIAAHWRYKEGGKNDTFEHKLTWLRSLLEWQNDMRDSRAFMENLKLDLFENQVFIFSPKGDVYSLPATATPLDFAFQVHTDVGNHCVGAKINGKIVPLDYQLKNGDICEVLVNKSSRPSLDWLAIVRTSGAKHKIKQWFRKDRKDENVVIGQETVERELAREHMRTDLARGDVIERIAKRMNYANATDLFAAIGFGDASAPSVIVKLKDEAKSSSNLIDLTTLQRPIAPARRIARNSSGIRIAGVDDVLVRLSKCCSPVPGDPIMGYVTIGKGVSVHRADCPNVAYMATMPERILQASWADTETATHSVDVEVEAVDRAGLLQDVMAVCSEYKTSASSVTARVKRDSALISLTLQISNLDHLHKVLEKFRTLRDVRNVYRVTKREVRASG